MISKMTWFCVVESKAFNSGENLVGDLFTSLRKSDWSTTKGLLYSRISVREAYGGFVVELEVDHARSGLIHSR